MLTSFRLQSGWDVTAVNTRGGLARDRLSVFNRLGAFLPVGFYYKAFHSKRWFPHWERMFRNLTGLGEVDFEAPARSTPKRYDFCDVLVVGAGPSGLAAALAAAERGASVLLVDENPAAGGSGLYARGGASDNAERTEALIASVRGNSRIRLLTGTYAAGYYADHWVALVSPECLVKVRARSVIVAQGAYEQPAVFRGNDLPGVMLASAAQRLLYHHAVAAARRVVVLTSNAEGYAAALDAVAHGVEVAAVLDLRQQPGPLSKPAADELAKPGVLTHYGVRPIEAVARASGEVGSLLFESTAGAAAGRRKIDLDGVWMSVGFAPANALLHQATLADDVRARRRAVRSTDAAGRACTPAVRSTVCIPSTLGSPMVRYAGACAAARIGLGTEPTCEVKVPLVECPTHPYPIFPHPDGQEFVDFDEDIQVKDLVNACQEGFDSSELLKRFSTIGMGPSQGKHSNMNALRILAKRAW